MLSPIKKFLFTLTVTSPIFFSLGLIGIIKDDKKYLEGWKGIFSECKFPDIFDWWCINSCLIFLLFSILVVQCILKEENKDSSKARTITVLSYQNLINIGNEQIFSSIIPWLTLFSDDINFKIIFFCILLQCSFITIANFNNSNYNLLCCLLGYRYYEVKTEENTYIIISKKCFRNNKEIKEFIPLTDYIGLYYKI